MLIQKPSLQFKIGDAVMHAGHGSGRIVAIEEKQLPGRESRLFYVVSIDKSTIWVPIGLNQAPNLRLLVSNSGLIHCRVLLKDRPAPLNANRQQRGRDRIHSLRGDSFEISCEALRDLTAHGWLKPLSEADTSVLRKIHEAVCQEWATAQGVPLSEAAREITALLQEGHQAYKADTTQRA